MFETVTYTLLVGGLILMGVGVTLLLYAVMRSR